MKKSRPIYSEEVHEIISKPSPRIARIGLIVFSLVLIGIFILCLLIRYPNTIVSQVTILSVNSPEHIRANASGKIDLLYVKNKDYVDKEARLAVMENDAEVKDVDSLKLYIKGLEEHKELPVVSDFLQNSLKLGEIQASFISFKISYLQLKRYISSNSIELEISSLRKLISNNLNYKIILSNKLRNQEASLAMVQRKLHRDSILFAEAVISEQDMELSYKEYLSESNMLIQAQSDLENFKIDNEKLQFEILKLEREDKEKKLDLETDFNRNLEAIKAAIRSWEHRYVLKTNNAGIVSFSTIWNEKQNVNQGEQLFTIVPTEPQQIMGRLLIPVSGSGNIDTNKMVRIKLDGYPYKEFGYLKGRLTSISLVPIKNNEQWYYMGEVLLNKKMLTNYKKHIPFSQEMKGVAEIITHEQSVFSRIIAPIKELILN